MWNNLKLEHDISGCHLFFTKLSSYGILLSFGVKFFFTKPEKIRNPTGVFDSGLATF